MIRYPNVERLLMVVGKLTLYPELHNQGLWLDTHGTTKTAAQMRGASCGTAGCVAGWAAAMFAPGDAIYSPSSEMTVYLPDAHGAYAVSHRNGEVVQHAYDGDYYYPSERLTPKSIPEVAKEYLGLSDSQANWLFAGTRTIKQLLAGIKLIIQRPSVTGSTLMSQFGE